MLYSNGYGRRLFHPKTILCPGTSILSPRARGKDVQKKGCVKQSRKRLLSLLELRRILFFYRK
ncbi:hypothetical protein DV870_26000 [Escherichia coli]|nr:hypothetical protein DV870_26000 [Escherichia coli]